jgi:16S rRNA (guanine527-N7)-methyltransferase
MSRFKEALSANLSAFDVELSPETQSKLDEYYNLLTRWNARLHLVAPCSPEEFATRHVLESLMLLDHLPRNAKIADIGSGAGLPIIPCIIARPDLHATLIESSPKKSVFLREASNQLGLASTVIAKPFEDIPAPEVSFVSCRALDRFIEKIPVLMKWAPANSTLLLYGGETLRQKFNEVEFEVFKIPMSERRYLFVVRSN